MNDSMHSEELASETGQVGVVAENGAGVCSVQVCVINDQGLHARPAARLAQEAQKFKSMITLCQADTEVDAKSILDILTLAAGQGSNLELRAEGDDASEALDHLSEMFKNRFR
ncbi:HPr family phosphocarrier protein [Desulfovibrio inopinatus]|uniref:HPr family phosphocarrier protein n=1 Tax=Desulfovibrio inopinatus TaxID=102109 RepID=UPI001FE04EC6|nr:HPr family phosphocarrier protein [Desulfovibrio inopinatus]